MPFAAVLGAGWLAGRGRRRSRSAAVAVVAGGVVWSNALAYRDVSLAPHDQLAELEEIGERVAGEGPTLMTEYEPYGARHFLRDGDPEGVSELRRHVIPFVDGNRGREGRLGRHRPDRPGGARPLPHAGPAPLARPEPSAGRATRLIWRATTTRPGSDRRRARGCRSGSRSATATTRSPSPTAPGSPRWPQRATWWPRPASARSSCRSADVVPGRLGAAGPDRAPRRPATGHDRGARSGSAARRCTRSGSAARCGPAAELLVDGEPAGEVRHELNNEGGYVRLGAAELEPGVHDRGADRRRRPAPGQRRHRRRDRAARAQLHRGGATPSSSGSPPRRPRSLCGREWDWIEVAG